MISIIYNFLTIFYIILFDKIRKIKVYFTVTDTATIMMTNFIDMNVILFVSSILNLSLLVVAIYLLTWRRALDGSQISIIPSELLSAFEKNRSLMSNFSRQLENSQKNISKIKREDSDTILELKDYLSVLTKSVTEKDNDIIRLKGGYDYKIFKGFLNRFIRVYKTIEEDLDYYAEKENTEMVKFLENLKDIFKEAFLDCGLKKFSPKEGEDFKSAFGVSKTDHIHTDSKDKDMKIAEIKNEGFKLSNDFGEEVIRPSFVKVYIYKKGA